MSIGSLDSYAGVTTPVAPDTEFQVPHNLGIVPRGFRVLFKDKYSDFRTAGTAWTTTYITLKCDTASVFARIEVI